MVKPVNVILTLLVYNYPWLNLSLGTQPSLDIEISMVKPFNVPLILTLFI